MSQLPVLIIGRNRADKLSALLNSEALRNLEQIYIFLDGPLVTKPTDTAQQKLFDTQNVAKEFCQANLSRIHIEQGNLGCYKGVTKAIDWFFTMNEKGLILEDDLQLHNQTPEIVENLLFEYSNNEEVGSISLYRVEGENNNNGLIFSDYPSSWGWATWRDRWAEFDHQAGSKIVKRPWLMFQHGGYLGLRRWFYIARGLQKNELDSWAYRWLFTFWLKSFKTIVSPVNMVMNVGFGEDATHTKRGRSNTIFEGKLDYKSFNSQRNKEADISYDNCLLKSQFGIFSK